MSSRFLRKVLDAQPIGAPWQTPVLSGGASDAPDSRVRFRQEDDIIRLDGVLIVAGGGVIASIGGLPPARGPVNWIVPDTDSAHGWMLTVENDSGGEKASISAFDIDGGQINLAGVSYFTA
jgi:hypothetical protein